MAVAGELMISQAPIMPGAGADTDLYTCPAGKEAVISSIVMCNTGTTATTVNVRKAKSGAASHVNQSGMNDHPIAPKETYIFSPAYTLTQTDKIRVSSASGNVVFDVNGSEVS